MLSDSKIVTDVIRKDNYTLLILNGELSTKTLNDFTSKTRNLTGNVILDMKNVSRTASCGIGAILSLMSHCTLYICGLNDHITTTLEMTGILDSINSYKNVEEAEKKINESVK